MSDTTTHGGESTAGTHSAEPPIPHWAQIMQHLPTITLWPIWSPTLSSTKSPLQLYTPNQRSLPPNRHKTVLRTCTILSIFEWSPMAVSLQLGRGDKPNIASVVRRPTASRVRHSPPKIYVELMLRVLILSYSRES